MQSLGLNPVLMPSRKIAVHVLCTKEAFAYADPQEDIAFIGAMIYHRGQRPFKLEQKCVDDGDLRCLSCNRPIKSEGDFSIAPSMFDLEECMLFMDAYRHWLNANKAMAESHVALLDHVYKMKSDFNTWRRAQVTYDSNYEKLNNSVKQLFKMCVLFGDCSASATPGRPTKLLAASLGEMERIARAAGLTQKPDGRS